MNKRQRKKAFKKWLARAVFIEEPMGEPIDVGMGAWAEMVRQSTFSQFRVPLDYLK